MKLRIAAALVLAGSVGVFGAFGCNSDDTGLTARTQSHVNETVTSESTIQVNAVEGVVTLSGVASSGVAHTRALEAARATEGVRQVVDHIATPTSLTGGKVPDR